MNKLAGALLDAGADPNAQIIRARKLGPDGTPFSMVGATPLMLEKFDHVHSELLPMLLGQRAGSSGETPALLILLCGLYLIARKMMDWRIPVAMLTSALLTSSAFFFSNPARYPNPIFMLLSGGLMLGAMFMATDPVSSPVTPLGIWIYGALIGLITMLIRIEGGLAEGVRRTAEVLAEHFPRAEDDEDELPNHVIVRDE